MYLYICISSEHSHNLLFCFSGSIWWTRSCIFLKRISRWNKQKAFHFVQFLIKAYNVHLLQVSFNRWMLNVRIDKMSRHSKPKFIGFSRFLFFMILEQIHYDVFLPIFKWREIKIAFHYKSELKVIFVALTSVYLKIFKSSLLFVRIISIKFLKN